MSRAVVTKTGIEPALQDDFFIKLVQKKLFVALWSGFDAYQFWAY